MDLDLVIISGCAILFSLVVSCLIWLKKYNARDWISVNAKIIKVDKEVDYVGFAKVTEANIRYRYEYKGKEYFGDKLSLFDHYKKSIGNWDLALYLSLIKAKEENREIKILMDPSNPTESVISTEFPSGKIFMLWFFGVGGVVILVLEYIF